MSTALLLLLADGRLPAGGHAHSGGVEAAVSTLDITDEGTLYDFLLGRLQTVGLVAAGLAAAAASGGDPDRLDAEADARTASPALRAASRSQGRALLRAGSALLAGQVAGDRHQAVALGVLAGAGGASADDVAVVAALAAVQGPATAAVRLLGLDPVEVTAVLGRLAPVAEQVARAAVAGLPDLPAAAAPRLDLLAEAHAVRDDRLFAS